MKRTEYFESSYEVAQHYPNGVPSTVIAIVGEGTNVFVSSDNAEGDKTQQYFSADLTNDEIVEQQVETAYTAGVAAGEAYYIETMTLNGTSYITTTSQYDVTTYAYAQVSDANLIPANIVSGTSILGVTGSYEGGGIYPSGTEYIVNTEPYDVTYYETAVVADGYLLPENIKQGVSILGVSGSYTGLVPSGTAYINANTITDVTSYAYAYCEASTSPVVDATVEILANQTSPLMFHNAWFGYIENHWDYGRASDVLPLPNTYYSYVPHWAVGTLSDFGNEIQEFYVDKITPNGVVDITSYCYVTGSGANTYINYAYAQAGDKIGAGLYNIYTYVGDAEPIWLYDETTGSHWLEAQSNGTFSIGFGLDENSEAPGNYGDTGEDPGEELGDCPYCEGTGVDGCGDTCPICEGSGWTPEGYRGETWEQNMIEEDGEPDPSYAFGYNEGWIAARNGENENYDIEDENTWNGANYPYVAGYCAGQQDWANANVGGEEE